MIVEIENASVNANPVATQALLNPTSSIPLREKTNVYQF